MELNRGRLAKVLAMTTSPHDGEALSAARRAAEMLARAELTYSDVLCSDGSEARSQRELELLRQLTDLRRDMEQMRAAARTGRSAPARTNATPTKSIDRARRRLLTEVPLRAWERNALEDMKQIDPRSREEYYVLWLLKRYQLADR